MKTLIAIINCHSRDAYVDAQRETWIPLIPEGVDYKIFRGRGASREAREDEVFLDCDDSYGGLPNKVQEVIRWALSHEYECMLKCDDDVVLLPRQFMDSGFQQHDFVGHVNEDRTQVRIPWGFCYTLSKRAMEMVSKASLPRNNNDEAWVSHVLFSGGVPLHHDSRYYLHRGKREEFIVPRHRPLRAPKRIEGEESPRDPVKGTFAYCMYLVWGGRTTDARNIEEMKKVWKEIN